MTRLRFSATQWSAFRACPRKWWFNWVRKMPEPPKDYFEFGSVLHEVCERYLLQDDQGNGPGLYPDGWDKTISVQESRLIQKLVAKAIDEGILQREPGRQIEVQMDRQIDDEISFTGKIDVYVPGQGITDHKTTKSPRYIKSPQALESEEQMLCYGRKWVDEHPEADRLRLRHNVFLKDPSNPEVRRVEAWAPVSAVERNWDRMVEDARAALEIKKAEHDDDDWRDVEGPRQKGACQAYGGCPYLHICSQIQSPADYREMHLQLYGVSEGRAPTPQPTGLASLAKRMAEGEDFTATTKKNGTVNALDRLKVGFEVLAVVATLGR